MIYKRYQIKPVIRRSHKEDEMNKIEQRYAQILELQKIAGDIIAWKFHSLKFYIAKKTWYTPDFLVVTKEHIEIHEVKGHWEDDARVKIKGCRELFPYFIWKGVKFERGGVKFETF